MTRRLVSGALLLGLAALVSGASPPAQAGCNANRAWQDRYPTWRSEAGIAFQRQEPGCAGPESVASVSPAGTQLRGLGPGVWPNAGAEGRLAMATRPDATGQLAVGTIRGPLRTLTTGGVPSWSRAADRVAFVRDGGLWVMNASGFEQRRLADVAVFTPTSEAHVVTPAWSPDGSRIAFVGPGVRIWVVGADGSDPRPVSGLGSVDVSPSWSPDGRRIAFASRRALGWDVASVAPDGSDLRLLAASAVDETLPAYSPVADRIAFMRATPPVYGKARLALVDGGGALQRVLGEDAHGFSQPAWSPDGSRIAYSSGRECLRWGLYVVEVASGAERRVTNRCRFVGTGRADRLRGTPFVDFIFGLAGHDRLRGGRARDHLEGGAGDDVVDGGWGPDTLIGGPGADRLTGDLDADTIDAGGGRDVVLAGPGEDSLDVRDGVRDAVLCGPDRDRVAADRRDAVGRDCETVVRR